VVGLGGRQPAKKATAKVDATNKPAIAAARPIELRMNVGVIGL
jgi:hypothetical protein